VENIKGDFILNSQIEGFVITSTGIFPESTTISDQSSLPNADEVLICENWIREYTEPHSKITRRESSYVLKHRAENWAKTYVSNGAFIQAAVNLDYRIEVRDNGPNACFGMKLLPSATPPRA
jgi:hypothetical protein